MIPLGILSSYKVVISDICIPIFLLINILFSKQKINIKLMNILILVLLFIINLAVNFYILFSLAYVQVRLSLICEVFIYSSFCFNILFIILFFRKQVFYMSIYILYEIIFIFLAERI